MNLAPVVLFVYNRPFHTLQTLEALAKNELALNTELFIFADGPKENASPADLENINETRLIIRLKKWCKEVQIIESDINKGLADSVIEGVTKIVNEYGRVIVLEDDLVTGRGFLKYMNEALALYESEEKVMHISGYMFPVKAKLPTTFFYKQTSCWGWGTWKGRWKKLERDPKILAEKIRALGKIGDADIDGTNQFLAQLEDNVQGRKKTWAVLWHFTVFIQEGLCLHPGKSLVRNIGLDNTGTNCTESNQFDVEVVNNVAVRKIKIEEYSNVYKYLKLFYKNSPKESGVRRIKNLSRKLLTSKMLHTIKVISSKKYRTDLKEEERIKKLERFTETETIFFNQKLKMVDNLSYQFLKHEIFDLEIYKFNCNNQRPLIIDCGANIGLSIIYFKRLFPEAEIIAFEPDKKVFEALMYNVDSFGLSNVQLIQKACWNEETTLRFFSEGADGGRAANDDETSKITEVLTTRLSSYLNRRVDFLKIDIEGAESVVIEEIKDLLKNVQRIFLEFHSFVEQDQKLPEILTILKNAGFRLHITAPGLTSVSPFVQLSFYANMDNQLNIYGYR